MTEDEEEYTEEDYDWELESGRCRYCGEYLNECTCDDEFCD